MATSAADKAKMAMLGGLDEEELDDQYLEDLDDEMIFASEQEKERKEKKKLSKGRLWLMNMPEKENAPGKRIATGRFLRPLDKGLKMVCHDKWAQGSDDNFNVVCAAELGLDCPYCKRICKKKSITRDQLIETARSMATYAPKQEFGFRTQYVHIHFFWYNEDNKGAGSLRIFAYPYNDNSPMGGVHDLNNTYYKKAIEKGKEPHTVDQYDMQFTQTGEGWERRFNVIKPEDGYEEFEHWEEVLKQVGGHKLDQKHLRWDFAIAKTYDKKLVEKYKNMAYEELGDECYKVESDDDDITEDDDEDYTPPKPTAKKAMNGRNKKAEENTSPLDDDIDLE
jgi:hypothetical protein